MIRRQYIDGSSYPPGRTGLRGSHPGSFEVGHEIRDGRRFDMAGLAVQESHDLVVVGAGISGLAAAWFFRRDHPDASILLLDNHDDFGGHAKRNEFTVEGRLLLGYGGSESLQSPEALYGPEAKQLLRALGIDYHRFERFFDTTLYPSLGLSRGVFFTKEAFGRDRLVTGDPMRMVADDVPAGRMHERPAEAFIADFPVSDVSKAQLLALYTVRDELTRMLGAGGFDADRDIAAITVNRWGHGYSYSVGGLASSDERPFEIARQRCGQVAFANADAAWTPLASVAIEQAHRAVGELLADEA